jgi:hypothetical protein
MANSIADVVAVVKTINHFKGKYVKELLQALEARGDLTPEVRKLVLDNFNGFSRAVLSRLGYSVDQ